MSSDGAQTEESRATIYDIQPDLETKVDVRRLPFLAREGFRTLWAAARHDFLLSTLLQMLGGVGVAVQLLIGRKALGVLFEAARSDSSITTILPWAGAVAGLSVILFFASALQRERQHIVGELVTRFVEERVLDVAAAVPLEAFETPSFHNRLQRIRSSSHQPLNLVYGVSGLSSAVIGVVGVAVALIAIQPILIPLVMVVFVPAWLVASRRGEAFFRFFWRMTPRDRERRYLAGLLTEREAAKEIRGFGLAGHLRTRYGRLYDERITELRRVARRQILYSLVANAGIGLVMLGTLLLVAWMTLNGRVALAEAGVAVAGVALVGARLTQAGYAAGSLAEAGLYLEDYLALQQTLADLEANRVTAPAPTSFKRLEVRGVTFTYPSGETPALTDVSLSIDEGEVVALVGENGSGKTTLAKLLAGLYSPSAGSILWDGTEIGAVDPDGLRRSVAVIFQDFLRYHLPARDNIGLGRHEAMDDLDRIREAARQADTDEALSNLPQGYETLLGPEFEGGTDLSIGQWQRVALARAFFRNAPFVILDEPTSALDARAEHDLFARIRQLLHGRTVLLISHRFSSVRSADRIYVLDGGSIVEDGTHDELVSRDGLYAELFKLQAAAYLDARHFADDTAVSSSSEPETHP